jgi:hypothetical protein
MELTVFIEAFLHQLMPMFTELTLPAMQAFGMTPLTEPIIISVFAALLAAMTLYLVGYLSASHILQKLNPERYQLLHKKLSSTLLLTMLVLGSPLGFILAFSAGYVRTPPMLSAALALLGLGAHYGLSYA